MPIPRAVPGEPRVGRYSEFFASGRSVPWWLAGLSMIATTFSSDAPDWATEQLRR